MLTAPPREVVPRAICGPVERRVRALRFAGSTRWRAPAAGSARSAARAAGRSPRGPGARPRRRGSGPGRASRRRCQPRWRSPGRRRRRPSRRRPWPAGRRAAGPAAPRSSAGGSGAGAGSRRRRARGRSSAGRTTAHRFAPIWAGSNASVSFRCRSFISVTTSSVETRPSARVLRIARSTARRVCPRRAEVADLGDPARPSPGAQDLLKSSWVPSGSARPQWRWGAPRPGGRGRGGAGAGARRAARRPWPRRTGLRSRRSRSRSSRSVRTRSWPWSLGEGEGDRDAAQLVGERLRARPR